APSLKVRKRDETGPFGKQVAFMRRLLQHLEDRSIQGRAVEGRLREPGLLARPRPLVRSYGSLLSRGRVTNSPRPELPLLGGDLLPETAEVICRALGVWSEEGFGADGMAEVVFTEPAEASDEPSIADLKQFLYALTVACSLDVPLRPLLAGLDPPSEPTRE